MLVFGAVQGSRAQKSQVTCPGHTAEPRLVPLLPPSFQSASICEFHKGGGGGVWGLPGNWKMMLIPTHTGLPRSVTSSRPSATEGTEVTQSGSFQVSQPPFPQCSPAPHSLSCFTSFSVSPDLFFYCQQNRLMKTPPRTSQEGGRGLGSDGFLDPPLTAPSPQEGRCVKNKVETENRRKIKYDAGIFTEPALRGRCRTPSPVIWSMFVQHRRSSKAATPPRRHKKKIKTSDWETQKLSTWRSPITNPSQQH